MMIILIFRLAENYQKRYFVCNFILNLYQKIAALDHALKLAARDRYLRPIFSRFIFLHFDGTFRL